MKTQPYFTTKKTWILTFVLLTILGFFDSLSVSAQIDRDEKTQKITGKGFEQVYNSLKGEKEDSLPYQVFLEINIFEVILSNSKDIGFVYDLIGELGDIRGVNLAGDPNIESDLSVLGSGNRNELLPSGANVNYTVFDDEGGELQALIQALAEDQILKVHANPILLTVDGVPARLETGDDIPFLYRASLGNVETVASKFTHTGVTLDITPYVRFHDTDFQHKNPLIYTEVTTNLATVSRYREEEGFAQPIIDTRDFTTSVWLKAGYRILIGSLFKDTKQNRTRGIPIIKDIPLLGRLFKSTSASSGISQLFIMIRPALFDIWGEESLEQSVSEQEQEFENLRNLLDKRAREIETEISPFEQFRDLFDRATPE